MKSRMMTLLATLALTAVIFYQNRVIAQQRHELVMQLITLTNSQMQQGKTVRKMNEMSKQMDDISKTCKK